MQAVILAGGLGTRLRHLTHKMPKPMVPVHGKPFLEYVVELLKEKNFEEIVICSGYLGHKIEEHFGNGEKFGIEVKHSREYKPLGTAGAIKLAAPLLREDFFVINGDTYLDFDYKDAYSSFLRSGKKGLFVVYSGKDINERVQDTLVEGERVVLYAKGKEDSRLNAVWAGATILKREILDMIPAGVAVQLENTVFPELAAKNEMVAYEITEKYYDMGTPERLEELRKFVEKIEKGGIFEGKEK